MTEKKRTREQYWAGLTNLASLYASATWACTEIEKLQAEVKRLTTEKEELDRQYAKVCGTIAGQSIDLKRLEEENRKLRKELTGWIR